MTETIDLELREKKIKNYYLRIFFLFGIFYAFTATLKNIFLLNLWMNSIFSGGILIVLLFLYYKFRTKLEFKYTFPILYTLTLSSILVTWFTKGGYLGISLNIFNFLIVFVAIFFNKNKYIYFFISFVTILTLFLLQYIIPESIETFTLKKDDIFDKLLTTVIAGTFIFLVIDKIKNKYQEDEKLIFNKHLELIERNNELEKINEIKDKFYTVIAHDLKTPTHSLDSAISYLKDNLDKFNQEDLKEMISELNHGSKNLLELLENLLEWSKIQSGMLRPSYSDFDLDVEIQHCLLFTKNTVTSKNIKIIYESKKYSMVADVLMIGTAIRNIIKNSLIYTPANGTIEIKVYGSEKSDFIAIKDNGIGMKSEIIDSLFKIDKGNKDMNNTSGSGNGLGLNIAYEFIKLHNGNISVSSQIGKGSEFIIELPKV